MRVETDTELDELSAITAAKDIRVAAILVRVEPGVDAQRRREIATGKSRGAARRSDRPRARRVFAAPPNCPA